MSKNFQSWVALVRAREVASDFQP